MSIRLSGILTLVAFLVVLGLLMKGDATADLLVRAIIWIAIGGASVYALVRLVRGQPHSTDQTAGLPVAIRRWLLGESGQR